MGQMLMGLIQAKIMTKDWTRRGMCSSSQNGFCAQGTGILSMLGVRDRQVPCHTVGCSSTNITMNIKLR